MVAVPADRVLVKGQTATISAQVVQTEIIEGKLQDELKVVGGATITCRKGTEVLEPITPCDNSGDESTLSFTVTSDEELILAYSGGIQFEVSATHSGEKMLGHVSFELPYLNVNPASGIFVVGTQDSVEVNMTTNFDAHFSYDFTKGGLLGQDVLEQEDKHHKVSLSEEVRDLNKVFGIHICKVVRDFKIGTDETPSLTFRAELLRESIIVPKDLKLPLVVRCYPDQDSDKREANAVLIRVKVMEYDAQKKDLVANVELMNNLHFEFKPTANNGRLTPAMSQKAIDDAKITVELEPNSGAASLSKPYATYRIYANALAEAESDNVNMIMTISCDNPDLEPITLDAQLKPRIDLKGLIAQFIEYPIGTYIGSMIQLGNIDTYHGALDSLTEIRMITSGDPNYSSNTNILSLRNMPESIAQFAQVQTIHHELAHTIEHINNDAEVYRESSRPWGERHSYFIQYLSDVAKNLADVERGRAQNLESTIGKAIDSYYMAYFNSDNLVYPVNEGEVNSWFGARAQTQHVVFDRYLSFSVYCQIGRAHV